MSFFSNLRSSWWQIRGVLRGLTSRVCLRVLLVFLRFSAFFCVFQGYFMIRRGTNECQFESQMVAGLADLNDVYVD